MLKLACPNLAIPLAAAYAEFREMISLGMPTGAPETPVGATRPDKKRYRDFIYGASETPPAIKVLHERLTHLLDKFADDLTEAFKLENFLPLSDLIDKRGGPVLRLTWYPPEADGEVNQPHTDIDLFTILPAATSSGLEIFANGEWTPAGVGDDEVAVISGEMLGQLGAVEATSHRVVADGGTERISASLFVNASPTLIIRDNIAAGDMMNARLEEIRGSDGSHG